MKLKQVAGRPNFYLNEDSGIYYTRKMVNGRLVDRSTGLRHEKAAFRRHIEIMKDLNDGKLGWKEKPAPSLAEWWAIYRESKTKTPGTWERNENSIKLWLMELGRVPLDGITTSMIERVMRLRKKVVKDTTLRTEMQLVSAVFEAAMVERLIERNPVEGQVQKLPRGKRTAVLSIADQAKLEAELRPDKRRWLLFMLGTGLRLREALGIVPSQHIDWQHGMITVTRKGGKRETLPLLDPMLLDLLADQVLDVQTNALWPVERHGFNIVLKRAARRAGIPHVHAHMLRHTFATRYLQGGGNIYILSKLLGHTSVQITESTYAHLLSPDLRALSQGINLGLQPQTPGKVLPFGVMGGMMGVAKKTS